MDSKPFRMNRHCHARAYRRRPLTPPTTEENAERIKNLTERVNSLEATLDYILSKVDHLTEIEKRYNTLVTDMDRYKPPHSGFIAIHIRY